MKLSAFAFALFGRIRTSRQVEKRSYPGGGFFADLLLRNGSSATILPWQPDGIHLITE